MEQLLDSARGRVWLDRTQRPFGFEPPEGVTEFALLVVVASDDVTPDEQGELSEAFVRGGCRLAMCWGHECSSWDDSIDWVSVLDEIDGRETQFVMTTWHENESLGETVWNLANVSYQPDWKPREFVALLIGESPVLERELRRELGTQFQG